MLDIEENTIVLEELDFDIPCRRKTCGATAEWMGIGNCCGHTLYQCDKHKNDFMHNMTQAMAVGLGYHHITCGKDTTDVVWHRV